MKVKHTPTSTSDDFYLDRPSPQCSLTQPITMCQLGKHTGKSLTAKHSADRSLQMKHNLSEKLLITIQSKSLACLYRLETVSTS